MLGNPHLYESRAASWQFRQTSWSLKNLAGSCLADFFFHRRKGTLHLRACLGFLFKTSGIDRSWKAEPQHASGKESPGKTSSFSLFVVSFPIIHNGPYPYGVAPDPGVINFAKSLLYQDFHFIFLVLKPATNVDMLLRDLWFLCNKHQTKVYSIEKNAELWPQLFFNNPHRIHTILNYR